MQKIREIPSALFSGDEPHPRDVWYNFLGGQREITVVDLMDYS